ncbi:L-ascorbate metabolism protein UlaG (beta-lactamase superfamily) [Neolewinella xylanilytica]|uniref:L-ascorbate metabolism protein UlaG (Beta-lactamase superfamily) n=1 Tax=Neolewinella xylanilytica TaxID=1514080 RepID=A0A2S6IB80_9BACT|nr:MBL fold metallo-hydrolase [Neolewinella xylanilytica]PPK88764.1 L-ascorbate metabolism protein UlaG (beta-lactamase superfamily) [Neolewinella xylanilytica]
MDHLLNPELPILPQVAPTWRGNPILDGQFQYVHDPFVPEWTSIMRMLVLPNPQRAEKKADKWVPPVNGSVDYLADRSKNWIVWLGHACFLLQLNGQRYLIDPQLEDMPLIRRRVSPPFHYRELTGIDYLLLSHDHRDHVDEDCIRTICANNSIRKILAPLRLSDIIGDWVGDTPIEEAAWYQQYALPAAGGVTVTFLPSRHWCRRGLTDFNERLWGSFMIEVGAGGAGEMQTENGATNRTIYFGGDSALTDYWKEIGEFFPNIDLAMLGIGAYKPEYMMRSNHANPSEAFIGYRDLGATYWWPMHHGTYDLSNEPASEPILWATKIMGKHGLGERLVQPAVNEPWWFNSSRE